MSFLIFRRRALLRRMCRCKALAGGTATCMLFAVFLIGPTFTGDGLRAVTPADTAAQQRARSELDVRTLRRAAGEQTTGARDTPRRRRAVGIRLLLVQSDQEETFKERRRLKNVRVNPFDPESLRRFFRKE